MAYRNSRKYIGYLILSAITLILLWHVQYSFCQNDEVFYVAGINRLYRGDRLIIDEWHPTQFYYPMFLPVCRLFMLLNPGGDGIILFFRVFYVLCAAFTAGLFYKTLYEFYDIYSVIPAALILLYSRANINGVSYYNVCFLCSILFVLFLEMFQLSEKSGYAVLSGVFLSFSILCLPHLILFALVFAGYLIYKKKSNILILLLGGALIIAGLYLAFLLGGTDFQSICENLSYILSDPSHNESSMEEIRIFLKMNRDTLSIPLAVYVPVSLFFIKKNKKLSDRSIWIHTAALIMLMLIHLRHIKSAVCFIFYYPFILLMLPAVFCYIRDVYRSEKKNAEIIMPIMIFAVGIAVSVCFMIASNTKGGDAATTGFCISSLGIILMCFRIAEKYKGSAKKAAALIFCVLLMIPSVLNRFLGIYRDAPVNELTERIVYGPAEGLITTEKSAEQYYMICDAIASLKETEGYILHSKRLPWAYLCGRFRCGSPTTWTTKIDSPTLVDYYSVHSERCPDYVFIYSDEVGAYKAAPFNNHTGSAAPNKNSFEGNFYEVLNDTYTLEMDNELFRVYHLIK